MPAKVACDHFTPHLFLSNQRCRDCDCLEADHVSTAASQGRGRTATLEQKVDLLVKDSCTHYTPHAWLVDRCRDCGRPESVHETSAGSIKDEEDDGPVKRAVKHAPIRNAQEIAALGSSSRRTSTTANTSAMHFRKGKKTTAPSTTDSAAPAAATADADEDEEESPDGSLERAQRVMDKAVAQMMLMDQELEDVRAQEAESLHAASISQAQYDANLAAIEAAFHAKEAELKAEVEAAKVAIEAAQAQLREEAEAEAKAAEVAKDELAKMRAEAERAREEAAALRAEAAVARSKAEEEREERERARQEELEAARAEIANARLEAETARAEAQAQQAQREEQERRERAAAEEREAEREAEREREREREAAEQQKREQQQREAEEVKEQDTQVTTPTIIPIPSPTDADTDADTTTPQSSPTTDDPHTLPPPTSKVEEDEAQPTAAVTTSAVGPYAGTVNLNEVLLKVEKLFLSGKNFFRFSYTKRGVVIVAVFLRVLGDEYVLCWSRPNQRSVHPSRVLRFSDIKAIVIGKQSTVFNRPEFSQASDVLCFSVIGGQHCLHLMAGNERDAEMTAFGLASLLKESRLSVAVFDHGQYREAQDSVLQETQQEQGEAEDGAPLADLTNVDQLLTGTTSQRVSASLSIRCTSLPLVHHNALVCLVDREEKTDRLIYVSQTEKVSKTVNPEFSREFVVEYELGSVRELRFNVYDVGGKSQSIDDGDRLGSLKVDVREIIDYDGVDFVYPLSHRDHAKNFKLIKAQSQLTVTCTKKEPVQVSTPAYATQRASIDNVQLAAMQSMLIKGDIFTYYTESGPACPVTLFYRCVGADAERAFTLGQLHYAVHADGKVAESQSVALRSICDVYVGKKQRSFPASALDDSCFSLLSKTGVRLDLEAKSKAQRDDYVNAITALLKHAAVEAKKKAHAKLGIGRQF